jgi:hypothetical protein
MRPAVAGSTGLLKAGRWTLLWLALIGAWLAVLVWYLLLASLGLVPLIVLVVFRIVRRVQRHGDRNRLRHAELLGRQPPG